MPTRSLESPKAIVRRFLKRRLNAAGFDLVNVENSMRASHAMTRAIRLAGAINTVIDVGASDGRWTLSTKAYLPDADYVLFEANETHFEALKEFEASTARVHVEYAAASDHVGDVFFYINPDDPFAGGASSDPSDSHRITLPATTIDAAVGRHALSGPYIIKLDTHGHEDQVLAGAAETLRTTNLLIIEVYGIDEPGRPAFDEVCQHLRTLGFKAVGLADVLMRPCDGAWWQADMQFVRADHPCFQDRVFH